MKREFLEGMGFEKDAIDKIMAEHGKTVESQKNKVTDLTASLEDVKKQLDQRDKDLKELKKQAEGNEDLKKKLDDLETQYKTDKEAYENKIKETQLSSALKLALAGKVHDADLVANLIDKAKIELGEDGSVKKGLDEQIKDLQTSKSFLFVEDQKPSISGVIPAPGGKGDENPPASTGASFAKAANDQGKNPENNIWG